MAITNAQQYQQLVNKPANGKRPGYRGDDAYGPSSKSGSSYKQVELLEEVQIVIQVIMMITDRNYNG